jgi:hypothetical protein
VILAWEAGAYSVELDLDTVGVPAGVTVDAIGVIQNGASVGISFDSPIVYSGTFVDDADILDLFTLGLAFDASPAGVSDGADLDAMADAPGGGGLIVSFDVGGTVGGLVYDDDDLLRVDLPAYTWSMELDASATDAAWARRT